MPPADEILAASGLANQVRCWLRLAHVRLLRARDHYPLLDDDCCDVLIASADTALRRVLAAPGAA